MGSMQYFGEKLYLLRKSKGWTQQQLANKVGLVKSSISAYEKSAKYPSIEVLINLCEVLEVSADYLIGLSDSMNLVQSNLTDEQMTHIRCIIQDLEHYNESQNKI